MNFSNRIKRTQVRIEAATLGDSKRTADRHSLLQAATRIVTSGLLFLALAVVGHLIPPLLVAALLLCLSAAVAYVPWVILERPNRGEWVLNTLHLVLLFGACVAAVHLLKLTSRHFPPTPWEEAIYTSALHFPRLVDIYSKQNLVQVPLYVSIYSPIYYGVLRIAVRLMGESLLVGRWLSAAGLLATAWLLALVLRTERDRSFSVIPPLLFLSMFPTLCWTGSFAKPEFLALPFSIAGLLAYVRYDRPTGRSWLLTSAVFCTLAILLKPPVLAGTAAIALHLLLTKRFRRLIEFALPIGVIVSAFYALFSWRTHSGFWIMTVVANNARLLPRKILEYALNVYLPNPIVVIGLAATIMLFTWEYRENRRPSVWTIFFPVALAWFFVTAGRPGGSYNYFLEAAAGCSIVIGLFLSRVGLTGHSQHLQFAELCLVLALSVNLGHLAALVRGSYDETDERTQIVKLFSGLKTRPQDLILADPQYAFVALKAGHGVLVNDSLMYSLMVDNRVVSDEPILNALRDHRVPYLFLAHDLNQHAEFGYGSRYWPREVVDYLKRHYSCDSGMKRLYFGQTLIICRRNAESVD